MLKLSMLPEDYMIINGDIVVQVARVAGGRADVAIHARREVPIVRGEVLERQGGQRPVGPPRRKRRRATAGTRCSGGTTTGSGL